LLLLAEPITRKIVRPSGDWRSKLDSWRRTRVMRRQEIMLT
jgi:hypothetical protein